MDKLCLEDGVSTCEVGNYNEQRPERDDGEINTTEDPVCEPAQTFSLNGGCSFCPNTGGAEVLSVQFEVIDTITVSWDSECAKPKVELSKTRMGLENMSYALVTKLFSLYEDKRSGFDFSV